MPRNLKPVDPTKAVRIEAHELPKHLEPEEGDYELKWGDKPKKPEYHDVITLTKRLKEIMPTRVDDILMKLQNFRKVYLNLATGEIF
jgi:hypothetical protein